MRSIGAKLFGMAQSMCSTFAANRTDISGPMPGPMNATTTSDDSLPYCTEARLPARGRPSGRL